MTPAPPATLPLHRPAGAFAGAPFAGGPPARRALPAATVGQQPVLLAIALAVVPGLGAVALGLPTLGAYLVFATAGALLGLTAIFGRPASPLAIVLGVLPAVMLLRTLVFYNAVVFLLAATLAWYVLRAPAVRRELRRLDLLLLALLGGGYWLASYLVTGEYHVNLRIMEAVLAALAVVTLSRRPEALAAGLLGSCLTLSVMGIALLGHGERLGYATVGGVRLGNPISFGLPLVLLLTLVNADDGRWLQLRGRPGLRVIGSLFVGLLLVLSTSRVSWLVAAAVMGLILLLNRRRRGVALVSLAAIVIGVAGVLQTSRGAVLTEWVDRTFSDERSIGNRTSGRSDQWMLFPQVMRDAPPWGFGPGSGARVYARYSLLDPRVKLEPGREIAWHSLYQHLAVEMGVVGLGALATLLLVLLGRAARTWLRHGELTPLLGVTAFALVALTVSGMDAASGLFLGFGALVPGAAGPRARP